MYDQTVLYLYYGCWEQKAQLWSCSAFAVHAGKQVVLFDPNTWQTHSLVSESNDLFLTQNWIHFKNKA